MLITEPVFIFALTLSIILVIPILFERFRLQGIIGLILAGTLVGPHGLGLLDRRGVFEVLGVVGLHMVMFIAGLEINLNEFRKYRKNSLVFGAFTFLIPQIAGTLGAALLLKFSWRSSILLASMLASHTLVTYPILTRLGLTKNRSVTATVGGTILTDTAAMLVLAIIVESTESALGVSFWLYQIASLGILLLIGFRLLPLAGYWFFKHIATDGVVEFLFILAAAFGTASISKFLRIEPILGSFFAGLALSQLVPEQSTLMNRIHFTANALFIPFFLISTGMLVNLSILWTSSSMWIVAVFMVFMVHAAKWLAASLSGRLLGFSPSERSLVFGLSVNQAAATLAAVMVGYRIGLFDDAVLNGTILMILVSCTVGAWATDRFGRRLVMETAVKKPDTPKKDRIMMPISNPATADSLIDLALMVRDKKSPEPLYPLFIVQEGENVDEYLVQGEQIVAKAAMHIIASEVPVHPMARIDLNVADGIMHAMKEMRISTLILGWSGKSTSKNIIFHTILDQIIEKGNQSIVVSKLVHPLNVTRRILVVIPPLLDRQEGFLASIRMLKIIAAQVGSEIEVIALDSTIAGCGQMIEKLVPSVRVSFHSLETWRDILPTLKPEVTPSDLIAFLSARRTQVSWQPSLEKIPAHIAKEFGAVNFLTMYPSADFYNAVEQETTEQTDLIIPDVAIFKAALPSSCASLEDAVRQLLKPKFGNSPHLLDSLSAKLLEMAPIDLAPGITLIHTHTSHVEESIVFIGTGPEGECDTDTAIRMLFLLLSPENRNPEKHLQILARLARLAKHHRSTDEAAV
jgi:Kef-type K+ transport system membrane component KefB/mannitol/fructose-specific phosphotransferase system IIA component (Ntr-type)